MGEELALCPLEFYCNRLHNRRSFQLGKLCLRCGCCGQASQADRGGSYCSFSGGSNVELARAGDNCGGKANGVSQSSGCLGITSEHRMLADDLAWDHSQLS